MIKANKTIKKLSPIILLDHLPQKIFLKDMNSVYTFCNQSYAADLKNKPEEIVGKTDYDFYPAELAEKWVAEDRRILAAGCPENREEQFRREGQSVIFHTVKMPVKDENGETLGILGVSWEVTDQKRKEDELKKICEHLEETLSRREAELQWANKLLQQEKAERRMAEERLKGAEGLRKIFEKAVLDFLTDNIHQKQAQEELCTSIEPFRRLVDELEKYLFPSNGSGAEQERLEWS